MWTIILLIVFFMFFRRTSGFTVGQTSVFDIVEFNSFPSDMKASLKIGINGVMNAIGKRISYEWNSFTPQQRQTLLQQYNAGFAKYIEELKAVSPNKGELDPKVMAAPAPMMAAPAPMMAGYAAAAFNK
jgi:hypothetical protein